MAGSPRKRARREAMEAAAAEKADAAAQLPQISDEHRSRQSIVLAAVASGINHDAIALALRMPVSQLKREFKAELAMGKDAVKAIVSGAVFAIATDLTHKDCVRAAQFWLQTQAGWKIRDERTHNFGLDGDIPAPSNDTVQAARVTIEFVNHRPKGLPGGPDDPDS